jgi:hypothetical protein
MKTTIPGYLKPVANRMIRAYLNYKFTDHPIIIGGPPRSGTTLLLSLLGSHPHIHAIDYETTAFHPRIQPEKLFAALFFENEIRRPRFISPLKSRFAEKTPGNIRHAKSVIEFFSGKVKIINIFRDARDVVTSRHPLDPTQYWVPIERWVEDVKSGLDAQQHYPNVLSIRYEDLVAETETVIRKACAFIQEDFDPRMMEYHKHTNVQTNLAWSGKARPIHAESLRKWENPEHASRINELMANSEAVMLSRQLGYLT